MFFSDTLSGSYVLAVLIKLLLAATAGGIIGFEREKHGRPAGLRTHLLVSVGSCLMLLVSEAFLLKYGGLGVDSSVRVDPGRTAAQIVTGIGFIGAGVILKEGVNIRGLTTAASLWMASGLGMAFGIGLFSAGAMATLLALFSLFFLKKLESLIHKDRYLHLTVVASSGRDIFDDLERLFGERGLHISDIASTLDLERGEAIFKFILTQHRRRIGRELTTAIAAIEGVRQIRYQ